MSLNPVAARLLLAALLATVSAATAAAEKTPEKTPVPQTVPSTTPPGTVTLDKMGDAAQRNLGRGAVSTAPAHPAAASASSEVRDWARIDSDHDLSISPSEMEAFLVAAHARAAGGK